MVLKQIQKACEHCSNVHRKKIEKNLARFPARVSILTVMQNQLNGDSRLDYIRDSFTVRPHRPSGFDIASPNAAPLEGRPEPTDTFAQDADAEMEERDEALTSGTISPELQKAFG